MADAVDSTYVPLAFGEATAWAKICLEDVVGTPTEGDDRELPRVVPRGPGRMCSA